MAAGRPARRLTPVVVCCRSLLFGEQFLEQIQRAGILGRTRYGYEGGNSLFTRTLRKREDGLFTHLAVDAVVDDYVVETSRGGIARRLAKPEYGTRSR